MWLKNENQRNGKFYAAIKALYQAPMACLPVNNFRTGFHENTSCNAVKYRAMWSFLRVHKLTPILAITGDIGWEPLKIRHKCEMLWLWNRVSLPEHTLTRKIFDWEISSGHPLANKVRSLLMFYHYFLNNNVIFRTCRTNCSLHTNKNSLLTYGINQN